MTEDKLDKLLDGFGLKDTKSISLDLPNSSGNRHSKIIKNVDNFIKQLHSGEIRISGEANKLWYGSGLVQSNLADNLANAIQNYEVSFSTNAKPFRAQELLQWINKAYTSGCIHQTNKENENFQKLENEYKELKEQLTKVQQEKADTEETLQSVSTDYLVLQGRYEELEKRLNQAFKNGDLSE